MHGISINKTYSDNDWINDLPKYDLFINGIIKKYWPYASNILKKDSDDKTNIDNILSNRSKLLSLINDVSIDDETCDGFLFSFIKFNIFDNLKNNINIIKLFAEITLDDNIPFVKIVLEDYSESYYKLYNHPSYQIKV